MANITPYSFIIVLPQTIIEILADAILCAAEGTGGETSRVFGTATQHPTCAAIREIHNHDSDGQFSETGLGLLFLVCMAVFPDTPSGTEHTMTFSVIGRTTPATSHFGNCPMKSSSISARSSRMKWNGASRCYS